MNTILALITGTIMDLILGDPPRCPHPIRWIGRMIAGGERFIRRPCRQTARSQYLGGMGLALMVCAVSFLVPFALLCWAYRFQPVLGFLLEALMCYQILALKSLKQESMKVYRELQKGDLPAARRALSYIVGRDTEKLDEQQVVKGAVETVAENLADGVIAPMFFILIGGAPLGFLYKAINTLDSMIGYKNEQYLHFGRFAARLDDLANYLPARMSAWLMIPAVFLVGLDGKGALRVYRRDRYNHTSPNSGHTEAVCAGALKIQLGGDNDYVGKRVAKPTIGEDLRPVEAGDIRQANKLLYVTACLGLLFGTLIRGAVLSMI